MNEPTPNGKHGEPDTKTDKPDNNQSPLPQQDKSNAQTGKQEPSGKSEQQAEPKLFTQEEVDRIVSERLKRGVKTELKKLLEGDGFDSIESVKQKLAETERALREYQQADAVQEHLAKAGITYRQDSFAAIKKLVLDQLREVETVTDAEIKAAVAQVKTIAPALFETQKPKTIDAGASKDNNTGLVDMNTIIRSALKRK